MTKKFNYYGIDCEVNSQDPLFSDLINSKFVDFKPRATFNLLKGKLRIDIRKRGRKHLPELRFGDDTGVSGNSLDLTHRYLTTTTSIEIVFRRDRLESIDIFLQSFSLFELVNLFTKGVLKKQLFQNLIKFYIEQTLLWYLTNKEKLICFHSAGIEKNGKVILFCGLNGVGKSTLAQALIQKKNYRFFSDNYTLVDKQYAYFSPEPIRLSSRSLKYLQKKPMADFGFGKNIIRIPSRSISNFTRAKVEAIYLVYKGRKWEKRKGIKENILAKINHLQIVNQEEVKYAKVSQLSLRSRVIMGKSEYPDCEYGELEIGSLKDFPNDIL